MPRSPIFLVFCRMPGHIVIVQLNNVVFLTACYALNHLRGLEALYFWVVRFSIRPFIPTNLVNTITPECIKRIHSNKVDMTVNSLDFGFHGSKFNSTTGPNSTLEP